MLIATIIFLVTLVVIFSERIPRTIAAIAGAVLMVGVGIFAGFYSEEQAIEAIDFHTVGLLLGMMTLVALLQPTGFFEYLAIKVGRLSKGHRGPAVGHDDAGSAPTTNWLFRVLGHQGRSFVKRQPRSSANLIGYRYHCALHAPR
jgi:NADH:ubiquinone oxidoreductase subunit 5 (subunit L)/multisubunit Na+/H+ antiporter MnhA subunit